MAEGNDISQPPLHIDAPQLAEATENQLALKPASAEYVQSSPSCAPIPSLQRPPLATEGHCIGRPMWTCHGLMPLRLLT